MGAGAHVELMMASFGRGSTTGHFSTDLGLGTTDQTIIIISIVLSSSLLFIFLMKLSVSLFKKLIFYQHDFRECQNIIITNYNSIQ
uniref:Uncharacterized protein n=1 Tax=Kalanchoe fedtschenkoi TaxID=63787 RepID=A0A7N0TD21_KALFE